MTQSVCNAPPRIDTRRFATQRRATHRNERAGASFSPCPFFLLTYLVTTMLKIHTSLLPKALKFKTEWLYGSIFFSKDSPTAYFIDEAGKVLFRFSKPLLVSQTQLSLIYHTVVFTKTNRVGQDEGVLCELVFFFLNPNRD